MKSNRMFGRSSAARTNKFGGTAGNSSSNNKPGPGTTNYDKGFTGERASRQGGGESLNQKLSGRPLYSDKSGPGDGGWAWDKSMSPYMTVPPRGSSGRGY